MRTRFIGLAMMFVLLCLTVSAQWVQTNGPFFGGQSTSALAVSETDLFVGTWGKGVFRSTDDGIRWTQVNSGLTEGCVKCFATLGTNIFAGTWWGHGVFRSTDRGSTWTPVGPDNAFVHSLAVDGTNLYAAIYGTAGGESLNGVFCSTDCGTTWIPTGLMFTNSSFRFTDVLSLAVSGKSLFAGTDTCVFRSADNGQSWTPLSTGPRGVWSILAQEDTLIAGGHNEVTTGVFRSTDRGETWSQPGLTTTGGAIVSLAACGANLFAGNSWAGVFCSIDRGKSWTAVNEGLTNHQVSSVLVRGTTVFATTEGGIFRSTGSDISWTQTGLPNMRISSLAINGSNLFAGTERGLFRSTDKGSNWTSILLGTIMNARSLAINGSIVFVGTGDGLGLFRSADNGTNWTQTGLAGRGIQALILNGRNLFAGTANGVFCSTDGDTGWVEVDSGLAWKFVNSLAVGHSSSGGTDLIAGAGNCFRYGSCGGGVFLLADNESSWAPLGLSGRVVTSVAVIPNETGKLNLLAVTSGRVYLSTGNDTIWTPADLGLANLSVSCVAVSGTNIFAGTDGGVYLSTNNGISWSAVNFGLTDTDISDLAVSGNSLFAGTSRSGVWQRSLTEMTTAVYLDMKGVPVAYQLQQNYPNPFNPSTTIRYGLPTRSQVTLTVFNMLGQHVATLQNGEQEAGHHEVRFDASGMASGVYFYRMTAGAYVETRKLLLIK